ncbi:unnamed protein product [Caenorhabditis sp. 36 PRJEB53466]|nr:unnamed protein product [Caenorhabditis sp. 36 PRJEB53466]
MMNSSFEHVAVASKEKTVTDQLKNDKMWYFIPVLTFPHLLMFSYILEVVVCLYFNIFGFLAVISFFSAIDFLTIYVRRRVMYLLAAFTCLPAAAVFLYYAVIMLIGDYSSVKASMRPAPTTATCFFLCFLNALAVYPFLRLSGVINELRNEGGSKEESLSLKK